MSIESIRQRLDAATLGPDLIAHAPTDLALLLEVSNMGVLGCQRGELAAFLAATQEL